MWHFITSVIFIAEYRDCLGLLTNTVMFNIQNYLIDLK